MEGQSEGEGKKREREECADKRRQERKKREWKVEDREERPRERGIEDCEKR